MRRVCAGDNVACLIDNLPATLPELLVPAVAVGLAVLAAWVFANRQV